MGGGRVKDVGIAKSRIYKVDGGRVFQQELLEEPLKKQYDEVEK